MSERLAPWPEYVDLLKPAGELRSLLMDDDPAHAQLLRRLFPPAYIQEDDADAEDDADDAQVDTANDSPLDSAID